MALTNRQLNLLEYMLANPMLPEIVCARNCGVPNSTYYDWKKKGEFTEELDKRLKEIWKEGERAAIDTMMSLCRGGDFKASKYILDNFGYAPAQKIEADISTEITINIED